jgi:hypothetical protein
MTGALRPLTVFISSTYEDLQPYVEASKHRIRSEKYLDQFKDWESTGRPVASECRERVSKCDVLVALVGQT